jgi:asparagine synthase (glutamine-hydrolysing)
MCGIVGLVDIVAGSINPSLLEEMRDVMFLRGPDGAGQYLDGALGMAARRLAVIDPAGGNQPFFSREGEVVAFQNGEIYNHRELRRQLETDGFKFVSHNDTEVVAHGFDNWGIEGLLNRLDGMYALAVFDKRSRELHLARDRFGEKPLFYTFSQGRFAYSSSLLVLASLSWVSDELDAGSLDHYLALHYVPGKSTIFKAIKRVLPGERLVVPVDDPTPRSQVYYCPPLGNQEVLPDGEMMDLIERAVESRLASDVPVGVFLSGGLDSSLIAAIAAKKQPRISTFSMGFCSTPHDESAHAGRVAEFIGSNHHHFKFDGNSFHALLPQVASALDEPVGDQALLPLYWLCQEARRHVTVALSGEGADEVFAGYSYYRNYTDETLRRRLLRWRSGRARFSDSSSRRLIVHSLTATPSGFPLLTPKADRQRLMGGKVPAADEWEEGLFSWLDGSRDQLQRAAATDLRTWLPDDLLVKLDRMSMAHSLEGRAPFLHPRIVETGLALPPSEKFNGGTSKIALRRLAASWLPQQILDRPKQGFVLPMTKWLSQWFEGQQSVRDYFLRRAVPGLDMIEVARLVEKDLSVGIRRERLIFALVLLVEWYQSFRRNQDEVTRRYQEAVVSTVGA